MGLETKAHRIVDLELPTDADVLALNASDWLGKVALAFDTKTYYKAVTNLAANDVWQSTTPVYDETTDTYDFPTTQDGHTQNAGQEMFRLGVNTEVIAATVLNPKIFASTGANVVDGRYSNMVFADAANITQGMLLAVNTTEALANGGFFKFAGWGQVNGVNTSAWALNAVLFLDTANPGEFTDVQPGTNAFPVARVDKVGATDGILFVSLLTTNRIDLALVPSGLVRFFLTGDTEVTTEGTFFLDKFNDQGVVATANTTAVVPDDSIVSAGQDTLGSVQIGTLTIKAGSFQGRQEFEQNTAGGTERIIWEVYKADDQGVVIDSGFAAESIGSLGVKTVTVLNSSELNSPTGTIIGAQMVGTLSEDLTLLVNQRTRTVIRGEKIGTVGGDKTFTFYVGSDHLSFLDLPAQITTTDVLNLSEKTGANQTDVNNNSLAAGGAWIDGIVPADSNLKNHMYEDEGWAGWPLIDTIDHLAPQAIGIATGSMDMDTDFPIASDISTVRMVHKYAILEDIFIKSLEILAPVFDSDSLATITVLNNTINDVVFLGSVLLKSGEPTIIGISSSIIALTGQELEVRFNFLNTTAASAIAGNWTSRSGVGVPSTSEFNIDNLATPTVIEIDHTDLDLADRSAQLDAVISGSIIRIAESGAADRNIEFEVDTVDTASATSTKYTVLFDSVNNGPNDIRTNRACAIVINVPISEPSEYGVRTAFYPTGNPVWATITTELYFGGVLQAGSVDGFPINLIAQPADISADWFRISAPSGSSGAASGSTPINSPQGQTLAPLDVIVDYGDTGLVMPATPISTARISIFKDGVKFWIPENTDRDTAPFYFSIDNGATALAPNAVVKDAKLYFNAVFAGFILTQATDRIDIDFQIFM